MKKALLALFAFNSIVSSNAFAAADVGSWYGGIKLGTSHYSDVKVNNGFSKGIEQATAFDYNKDNVAGGIFGGYQLLPWLAVEIGYDYLGNLQVNGNNGAHGGKMEAHGLQASLKSSYQVANDWDIYGRAGLIGYHAESKFSGHSELEGGIRPLLALGTEYAFTKDLSGRLEYQWVSNVGNVNQIGLTADAGAVTAGMVYRFGNNDS